MPWLLTFLSAALSALRGLRPTAREVALVLFFALLGVGWAGYERRAGADERLQTQLQRQRLRLLDSLATANELAQRRARDSTERATHARYRREAATSQTLKQADEALEAAYRRGRVPLPRL